MLPELAVGLTTQLQAAPLTSAMQLTSADTDPDAAFAAVLEAFGATTIEAETAITAKAAAAPAVMAMPAAAPAPFPTGFGVSEVITLAATPVRITLPPETGAGGETAEMPALLDHLIAALKALTAAEPNLPVEAPAMVVVAKANFPTAKPAVLPVIATTEISTDPGVAPTATLESVLASLTAVLDRIEAIASSSTPVPTVVAREIAPTIAAKPEPLAMPQHTAPTASAADADQPIDFRTSNAPLPALTVDADFSATRPIVATTLPAIRAAVDHLATLLTTAAGITPDLAAKVAVALPEPGLKPVGTASATEVDATPQADTVPTATALIAGVVDIIKALKAELEPAASQQMLVESAGPKPTVPFIRAGLMAADMGPPDGTLKLTAEANPSADGESATDVATVAPDAADCSATLKAIPIAGIAVSVAAATATNAQPDRRLALTAATTAAPPAPLAALPDKLLVLANAVKVDAPRLAAKLEVAARLLATLPPDITTAFAAAIKITGKSGPLAALSTQADPAASAEVTAASTRSPPAIEAATRLAATLQAPQLPQLAVATPVLTTADTVEPRQAMTAGVSSETASATPVVAGMVSAEAAISRAALPLTGTSAKPALTPVNTPAGAPSPQIAPATATTIGARSQNSPAATPAGPKSEPRLKSVIGAAVAISAPGGTQGIDTAAASSVAPTLASVVQHTAQTLAAHTSYQSPLPQPNLPALAGQFARKLGEGASSFDIRLDPSDLGRIDVKLDLDGKGGVVARMIVERPETLDLLQRDQRGLERALQQAGLDTQKTSLEFSLKQNGYGSSGGTGHGQHGQPGFGRPGPKSDEPEIPAPVGTAYHVPGPAGGVNRFV